MVDCTSAYAIVITDTQIGEFAMDWIMYTVGVVSHIMAIIGTINVLILLDDVRVKYYGATVRLNNKFVISWVGVTAFWMWYFFG
jgi:hypothetical protein